LGRCRQFLGVVWRRCFRPHAGHGISRTVLVGAVPEHLAGRASCRAAHRLGNRAQRASAHDLLAKARKPGRQTQSAVSLSSSSASRFSVLSRWPRSKRKMPGGSSVSPTVSRHAACLVRLSRKHFGKQSAQHSAYVFSSLVTPSDQRAAILYTARFWQPLV